MASTTGAQSVYLFRWDDVYKIGRSKNPAKRLWEVGPQTGDDAEVIHSFPSADAYSVESAMHQRFNLYLIRSMGREWFRLMPAHVDEFRKIQRADCIDDLPPLLRPKDHMERIYGTMIKIRLPDYYADDLELLSASIGMNSTIESQICHAIQRHLLHPPIPHPTIPNAIIADDLSEPND